MCLQYQRVLKVVVKFNSGRSDPSMNLRPWGLASK